MHSAVREHSQLHRQNIPRVYSTRSAGMNHSLEPIHTLSRLCSVQRPKPWRGPVLVSAASGSCADACKCHQDAFQQNSETRGQAASANRRNSFLSSCRALAMVYNHCSGRALTCLPGLSHFTGLLPILLVKVLTDLQGLWHKS